MLRYFTTKKTAYTFYGDGTEQQEEGEEGHEMKSTKNGGAPVAAATGNGNGHDFEPDFSVAGTNGNATAAAQLPNPASNPFRKDATSNPFNQSNV